MNAPLYSIVQLRNLFPYSMFIRTLDLWIYLYCDIKIYGLDLLGLYRNERLSISILRMIHSVLDNFMKIK